MKCHQEVQSTDTLRCILCSDTEMKCFSKYSLFEHFQESHNIKVTTEMSQFTNVEEFESWKKQVETETHALFINAHGSYKTKNQVKTKYVCHRSGFYKSKGNGMRRLKTQGSSKINGYCPAEMCIKIMEGKYEVKFVKTHVGHSNNLEHLKLTRTKRKSPAGQIASRTVLEVQNSNPVHLIDGKPVLTIEKKATSQQELQSVDALTTSKEDTKLSDEKKALKLKMLKIIDSVMSVEELDVISKVLVHIERSLTAFKNPKVKALDEKPSQKIPQKKFFKSRNEEFIS